MATWGLKVSDELKEKLDQIKKESGLEGEQFAEQLVTLFLTEELKAQKPQLSAELEELQGLTQRIYSIYLHSAERTENLFQSKEETHASELNRCNEKIRELEQKVSEATQSYETMIAAYNNLTEDKDKIQEENKQLIDGLKTKQELIDEYKSKNDTLTGIVDEYKQYKDKNSELSKTLQDTQKTLWETNISLNGKEAEIRRLSDNVAMLEQNHSEKIADIKESHKTEIERLNQQHVTELERLNDRNGIDKEKALIESDKKHRSELNEMAASFNEKITSLQDKISGDNEKYKSLLEELEKMRNQINKNKKED